MLHSQVLDLRLQVSLETVDVLISPNAVPAVASSRVACVTVPVAPERPAVVVLAFAAYRVASAVADPAAVVSSLVVFVAAPAAVSVPQVVFAADLVAL